MKFKAYSSAVAASFFLWGHKKNKKCGKRPYYIYDVHTEWRWEGLKAVTCLWILLFLNNNLLLIFVDGWVGRVIKLVLLWGHRKCKTPKLVIFYDEKIHHVQVQKASIKCTYRERGSKLMVVRTHTDYRITRIIPFRLKIKIYSYLSAVHISFYLLNFEYPFIML